MHTADSQSLACVVAAAVVVALAAMPDAAQAQEEKPLEFEDIVDKRTYDKMRPPKPEGRATTVSFHVTVMSLDTIDEGSMTYAADVFFAQEWKDHRLILPDNMTREYRLLPVEWLHLIWRPDSFFKNAKKVTFQTMTIPNHYLWLYKDKTILYMVKLTLLLSCAMHFENYPHDEQLCKLSMESLSHTTDDLVFIWLPEDKVPLAVDTGIELPQLELVSNVTGDCTSVYSTGNFTCLEVIFKFRRRLGYYLFHTYIPTCLIVMMSWISFWIKPEAVPARAIDIFMSSCTVFVFLSLIEYAFVNVMMGDISEVERKDKASHLRSIIVTANHVPYLSKSPASGNPQSRQAAAGAAAAGAGAAMHPHVLHTAMQETHLHNKDQNPVESCEMDSFLAAAKGAGGPPGGPGAGGEHCGGGTRALSDPAGPGGPSPPASGSNANKKDPKEIMKKRRERAICIDRVSRVIFPSTFILLNIIYWLVFSEILTAIKNTTIGLS